MKILIVSATPFEIAPLRAYLEKKYVKSAEHQFQKGNVQVSLLITGVGLPLTAYALGKVLALEEWSLVVNAGVAGSLSEKYSPGDVVQVVTEAFADLGVEEADGSFTSVSELGLIAPGQPPFSEGGKLENEAGKAFNFLPVAHGISVNKVHGHQPSIADVKRRFPEAEVETMEGAAFFYACLLEKRPFIQIRSISNKVEPRNREAWEMEKALDALNTALIALLQSLFNG